MLEKSAKLVKQVKTHVIFFKCGLAGEKYKFLFLNL